jgi:murein DD-endopeptidase MepM/ murein hydrolase activator NlpD
MQTVKGKARRPISTESGPAWRPARGLPKVYLATLLALLLLSLLAATVSAQEPTPEPQVYVVQPGDTLYRIAERFGTTVQAIVAANDIANPSLINVGQKLIIPTAEAEVVPSQTVVPNRRVHPVLLGETLPSLAFRYRSTVWTLREVNELDRLELLLPGQELTIPLPSVVISDTPGFPAVLADPAPVAQGQTMLVEVQSPASLELQASFLGQDLAFFEGDDRFWALVGVDALTPAGTYPLTLVVTETETGDRLTMRETFTVTKGSFTTYNVAVPADRQNLLDPTLSQAEARKVNAIFAGRSDQQLWEGAFDNPLAGELRVTAAFGQRRSYNGGPVTSYHTGQDLGADEGVPIYATAAGRVVLAEPLQVRGRAVILDHGLGVFTGFWHLSEIDVTVGQMVEQGEVIGLVGNTGLSTGPHLHWEMQVRGVPVNPFQWTERAFP